MKCKLKTIIVTNYLTEDWRSRIKKKVRCVINRQVFCDFFLRGKTDPTYWARSIVLLETETMRNTVLVYFMYGGWSSFSKPVQRRISVLMMFSIFEWKLRAYYMQTLAIPPLHKFPEPMLNLMLIISISNSISWLAVLSRMLNIRISTYEGGELSNWIVLVGRQKFRCSFYCGRNRSL